MFDKMKPKLIGIINSDDHEAEDQIVTMSLLEDSVLKMELEINGIDTEMYLKMNHLQVAINEMLLKQTKGVKKESNKVVDANKKIEGRRSYRKL